MKYIVLIGDGMSDLPIKKIRGKTPLEAARTPHFDFLAQNGICGWTNNVPKGMPPGSDVAAMSIFGYDPKKSYTGRGPLEAESLGIKLKDGQVAFRCNLVTIRNGLMEDFTAGHISNREAKPLIEMLNYRLGGKNVKFYLGLSYRHVCVIDKNLGVEKTICTPPHNITGKNIEKYLPYGTGNELINYLMSESIMHLLELRVNIKRITKKLRPANLIWLWGQGIKPKIEKFKKKYQLKASVITAVHLLKGLGKTLGMDIINVPGATGYLDTNYKGKAKYALKALSKSDIVFIHVEAPDEAGHMGDLKAKIKAIEDLDGILLKTLLNGLKNKPFRLLLLPDHPTPICKMTHTADNVPFVIFDSTKKIKGASAYNERAFKRAKKRIRDGYKLLPYFIR
jgi:2,3-bisphosphoglycerate-independent phosphoglycerate mutase